MKKIIALILFIATLIFALTSCAPEEPLGSVSLYAEATHDVVVEKMLSGEAEVLILPEPKATVGINKAKANGYNYSIKLSLSAEWDKISDNGLAMGCIVAGNGFISENESSVVKFLADYKASLEYIGNEENHESAAALIVSAGILPQLPIAKSALTNLYGALVYQDGQTMKDTLVDFYTAIEQEKPEDSFYYIADSKVTGANEEKIKIGVLSGPTGMGLAKLMSENGTDYEFVVYPDPSQAQNDLLSGEIDMACLPTNNAATLKNAGADISVTAINCLGSLYVIAKDGVEINSVADLIDKTVYYGVPASTTKPIISYILKNNNIEINDKSE